MAKIPEYDPIYEAIENDIREKLLRPYLGMSMLGHPCDRYLWLYFRLTFHDFITPRTERIFSRGDLEEARVIADLEYAGCKVSNVLDEQQEFIHDSVGKHCSGHGDGQLMGVPGAEKTAHLLEIKTMAEKYFRKLQREGIQKSNPKYYCQAQIYMRYAGLDRVLFVVTNKNDESRHYERIPYNSQEAEMLNDRATFIVESITPPERISNDPEWYQCSWCPAKETCFKVRPHEITCRTCENVVLNAPDGSWTCSLTGQILSNVEQHKACDDYISIHVA